MDNSVCNSFLYHLILQKTSNEIQVTTVLFSTRMKRYIFDLNIEFQCYQTNVRPLNSQLNIFCINIRIRLIYFNEWKLMYWKCEVTWPPLRDLKLIFYAIKGKFMEIRGGCSGEWLLCVPTCVLCIRCANENWHMLLVRWCCIICFHLMCTVRIWKSIAILHTMY